METSHRAAYHTGDGSLPRLETRMKPKPETADPGVAGNPGATLGWSAPPAPEPPPEAFTAPAVPESAWPNAAPVDAEPAATTVVPDWSGVAPAAPESFDVSRPLGEKNPEAVIASALLEEPQQEGLRYLLNYANKSIRKNRGVPQQDHDDLLHEIYMEWWVCVGFEVAALPRLLDAESPERRSLRESVYRVFGRYRYHQTAHRMADFAEGECADPDTLASPEGRDFTLDLEDWLRTLPDVEAKIIDLYYFQHKTMEEIGSELGLAKQRVSEIHKRALARHPDGAM